MDTTDQRAISRRTLARGAAWAAPTVALAVAAPAVAASPPVNCPEMPTGSAWAVSSSGSLDSDPAVWNGDTLQVETDNTSTTASNTLDYTTTIPVEAGTRYTISFEVQTRAGYGSTGCATTPSQFNVFLNSGGGFSRVINTTSAPNHPNITSIAPPTNCTEPGPGTAEWGADGTVGATETVSFTYTATSTGSISVRMRFFLQNIEDGTEANDDWRVTPYFESCEETA